MLHVEGDNGPAVLLLPGGAEGVAGFFPGLAEGLREDPGVRVILYDRPGNGPSDDADGLRRATAALHAAIAEAGAGPVVAIGQSLGGAVAVMLAADYPEDVAGLVLLDPTPLHDPALAKQVEVTAKRTVAMFRVPVIGALLRGMLMRTARKSAVKHRMTAERRAAMDSIASLDAAKLGRAVDGLQEVGAALDLSAVPRVPAVVVTADRKRTSSITRAHEALATAIGASVVSWPTAEHYVHLSHPDEVLATSRDVLRRATAA